MPVPACIHTLVDDLARRLETFSLTGEEQEEYSTMLSRLEHQADREEPDYAIVIECIDYFTRFSLTVHRAA